MYFVADRCSIAHSHYCPLPFSASWSAHIRFISSCNCMIPPVSPPSPPFNQQDSTLHLWTKQIESPKHESKHDAESIADFGIISRGSARFGLRVFSVVAIRTQDACVLTNRERGISGRGCSSRNNRWYITRSSTLNGGEFGIQTIEFWGCGVVRSIRTVIGSWSRCWGSHLHGPSRLGSWDVERRATNIQSWNPNGRTKERNCVFEMGRAHCGEAEGAHLWQQRTTCHQHAFGLSVDKRMAKMDKESVPLVQPSSICCSAGIATIKDFAAWRVWSSQPKLLYQDVLDRIHQGWQWHHSTTSLFTTNIWIVTEYESAAFHWTHNCSGSTRRCARARLWMDWMRNNVERVL